MIGPLALPGSLLALALPLATQESPAYTPAQDSQIYTVRSDRSRFEVKVGTAGLFGGLGHEHLVEVRRFSGQVDWRPASPETSSVSLEIEAASLTVVDPDFDDEERARVQADMGRKVLAIERFPLIRFVSKAIAILPSEGDERRASLTGELFLHGSGRAVQIPLRFAVTEEELRARGNFQLKGTDFGIKPVSAGLGTVKTKDRLDLSFELVCIRDRSKSPESGPAEGRP